MVAAMLPDAVKWQAMHPFLAADTKYWPRIETAGVTVCLHHLPIPKAVEPVGAGPDDVRAAVEAAREIVREHNGNGIVWWVAPEHAHLGEQLERAGLANTDAPGFEETENALVLLEPPAGETGDDVDVVVVQTIEEFDAANGILEQAFGLPAGALSANRDEDWERYRQPDYPFPQLLATVSGRPVGSATAAYFEAGVNLFGGGVLEEARGHGVYRALIAKRWELAVERGTPALTVQAGRMSRPILERVGFQFVAPVKIYADAFTGE